MPPAGRYIMKIENTAAGASNPALVTFHLNPLVATQDETVAQLIALSQYLGSAAGCTTIGMEYSVAPTGPTLPLPFPVTEYATLVAQNGILTPGAAYPIGHGAGGLTALGVGAVVSRRTTTPGRSGRGRFTTPWLSVNQVSGTGGLVPLSATTILAGCDAYLSGVSGAIAGVTTVFDLGEYVFSSTGDHLVTARTVSSRLGRLRSRTA